MSDAPLPFWPEGTATTLTTIGDDGAPHAIPVSTALRGGPSSVVLGLGRGRTSLANLRSRPAVALCVLAEGVAFTAEGVAVVVAEDAAGVVAVRIDVAVWHDHVTSAFALEGGVAWRWTDAGAAARDAAVREALRRLG
ncbi:MAG TPA: pyridoxamine 5'-phosphate oxidase family protein [Baekduia sp.]|nr:pyridoxamine 5'-phosphate oxidase family protein [Baekduia sp.]